MKGPGGTPSSKNNTVVGARLRDAWPWFLLILMSLSCIVAQSFGFLHEGVGKYLYIVACTGSALFGLIGLAGWIAGRLAAARNALYWSSLVAAPEKFFSEIESKRPDYEGHWKNVAGIARAIGIRMGMKDPEIRVLTRAVEVMDLGMLEMLEGIGTGPADESTREAIRKHPLGSEEILDSMYPGWDVLPLVRHHHECFDGSGYPDGLRGDEIPLGARILAVADSFVAMTSDRPYKKRRTAVEAVDELKAAKGSRYDPGVVETLVSESRFDESGEIGIGSPVERNRQNTQP